MRADPECLGLVVRSAQRSGYGLALQIFAERNGFGFAR
jgi:hypothetical protein